MFKIKSGKFMELLKKNANNESTINPMLIENIAATAFWTYVHNNGFKETIDSITERLPPLMWSVEKAQEAIIPYLDFDPEINLIELIDIKEIIYKTCYEDVLEIILKHVREERNILGAIFVEDFTDCKQPDFQFKPILSELERDSDANSDYKIITTGDFIHVGTLLLRTPLPSGILLKDDFAFENPIIVKNTEKALGFHKTIVFIPDGMCELPPNPQKYKFFISGIFHLPTKRPNDLLWHKILSNTTCICEETIFALPNDSFSSLIIKPKTSNGFLASLRKMLKG